MASIPDEKQKETAPLLPSTTTCSSDGLKWTVDEALSHIGKGRFQSVIFFVLGFAYTADAAEMLLLSFVGPDVKCQWNLTAMQQSTVTMVVFLGMATGALIFGTIADFFGRKPAVVIDIALSATAGLLSAAAPNVIWLAIFRFLVGLGLGGFILTAAFLAEFMPIENRGITLCGYQMFWSIGACVEALLAWAVMPHYYWRGLIVASSVPLVILLFVVPFIPESPRYLLVNGRADKAKDVLALVAKVNGATLPTNLELYVKVSASSNETSSLRQFFEQFRILFTFPLSHITPSLWLSWITAAMGYFGIIILTTNLQADNGDGDSCTGDHVQFSNQDFLHIFIDAVAEIPAVLFIMFTIDHFGRKKVLLLNWIGAALSMILLPISSVLHTALLFSARFFIASAFDLVIVMASELYPSTCRSFGVGMGNLFSRFGGAISPFATQGLYDACGLNVVALSHAALFAVVGASSRRIPIEKAGKSMTDTLEDVAEELRKAKEARNDVAEPLMP